MYAKTMDAEITELPVDMARLKSDWANYLFRFEELWADVRNDDRWAHRLTVHNIAVKQGAVIETALSGAVRNDTDQMADLSSQLATYGNGIAKYAGYKRGLNDTADYFNTGTKFLPMKQPNATEQVLGPVTGHSRMPASNDQERKLAEREAMHGVIKEAIRMGANAVLDLKMVTDSYEHTDPKRFLVFPAVKFTATKVTYAGTAAKVAMGGSPEREPRGTP